MKRWIDRGPKWIKRDPLPYTPYHAQAHISHSQYHGAPRATERWIDRAKRKHG
ncbi:MAG: hypothetical protein P3W93_008885 [Thermus sp.]|nr:hypothetical protein [Thermus sp.]